MFFVFLSDMPKLIVEIIKAEEVYLRNAIFIDSGIRTAQINLMSVEF
jgi:hypothetical protein